MTSHDNSRSYCSLLDNLPGMAYRRRNDEDWSLEYVSDGCRALMGCDAEHLLNGDWYTSFVHPDDVESVREHVESARKLGTRYEIDYQLMAAAGRDKWVRDRGQPVFSDDGTVLYWEGYVADVSDLKLAQAKLSWSNANAVQERTTLDTVVSSSPDLIYLLDSEGRFLFANPLAARFLGLDPDQMIGKSCKEIDFPSNVLCQMSGQIETVMLTADTLVEEFRVEEGEWAGSYEYVLSPVYNGESQVEYVLSTVRDITARKLAEKALRQSNERLQETLNQLQQVQDQVIQHERLNALGTMASGVAHDFNNALSPILGFTDLMLKFPEILGDREQTTKYLQAINTSATDASSVVNRLKEFYRHRERTDVLVPVDLNEIVEEVAALTEPKWKTMAQATGRDIDLRMLTGKDMPMIVGDASSLRNMLTNLVINAVDAMPRGGALTIRTGNDGTMVRLDVSDTGVGMTSDVKMRAVEPFFTTKGSDGTGMGLAMVHGIVERHDGYMEVESALGAGTTFSIFFLPLVQKEEPTSEPAREEAVGRCKVLVVDDEPLVRDLLRRSLRKDGYVVELAADGDDALDRFLQGRFDLVITDWKMPGLSGDQLSNAIQMNGNSVSVIMITGFPELFDEANNQPSAVDYILPKPLTHDALRTAIHTVLQETRSGKQPVPVAS